MDNMNSPISSVGRAVQAKTAGMGPDQIQQVATQYDKLGLMSFNDVISLKNKLDALKNQGSPTPPKPTTTVVDDMQSEVQGRMQGIANLPVDNVGNPANYARGGIVSFKGGGTTFMDEFGDLWERAPDGSTRRVTSNPTGARMAVDEDIAPKRGPHKARVASAADIGLEKPKGFTTKEKLKNFGKRNPKSLKLAKGIGTGYVGAAAFTAAGDALDPIPTENMYDYYGVDPNATHVPQLAKDLGIRALGTGQRAITLGLTGPQKDSEAAAAEAAPAKGEAPFIPMDEYSQGIDGLLASMGASGSGSGGRAGYAQADTRGIDAATAEFRRQQAEQTAIAKAGAVPQFEKMSDEMKKVGIGMLYEEELKRLEGKEAEIAGDEKQGKWLSAADAFFEMARAGGEDGATFMGAAGAGGAKGTQSYRTLLDQIEAKRDKIDDRRFQVKSAQDTQKQGIYTTADSRVQAAEAAASAAGANAANAGIKADELRTNVSIHNANNATEIAKAGIAAAASGNTKVYQQAVARLQLMSVNATQKAFAAKNPAERARHEAAAAEINKALGELTFNSSGTAVGSLARAAMANNPYAHQGTAPPQGGAAQGGTNPQYLGVE